MAPSFAYRRDHFADNWLIMMIQRLLPLAVLLLPSAAIAEGIAGGGCATSFSSIPCLAQSAGNLIGLATAALIGVAIVIYFWGIVRNLFKVSGGNATSFEEIRTNLVWGLVALVVIFSIWGIIRLLGTSLFGTSNFNSLW